MGTDCFGSSRRHIPERPADRSCRTGSRSESRVLPSLWHAAPPGASGYYLELLGCPISNPSLRLALTLNKGCFPPPALPGFHGTTSPSVTSSSPACPSRESG